MIKTEITLKLKTFHGSRKIYEIITPITDKLDKVKAKLISMDEDKELSECKQIRLIHPMVSYLTNSIGEDKGATKFINNRIFRSARQRANSSHRTKIIFLEH